MRPVRPLHLSLVPGQPVGRPQRRGQPARLSKALGVQPRTLQRHLARAGTSFQQVLDDVRRSLACAQLEEGEQPISDIALDLGFQEFSAFTHSFRRWTGVSPRAYRKANRVTSDPREPVPVAPSM